MLSGKPAQEARGLDQQARGVLRSQTGSPLSQVSSLPALTEGRNGLVLLKRPPPCGIPRSGFVSSSVTKQTEDLNGSTSKYFLWVDCQ